jgi:competence protein ComEC
MRAPVRLPALALALATGILAAGHLGPLAHHPGPWLSGLVLLIIAGASRRFPRARWLSASALAGGALAAHARTAPPIIDGVDDRDEETLVGVIRGPTTLAGDRVGARLVTDDGLVVWIWGQGDPSPLSPGDRIAATGRLRTPRGYLNPGEVDRRVIAAQRGVDVELAVTSIERLGTQPDPWRWPDAVRRRWSSTIAAASDRRPAAAIVRGTVTGDRSAIDDATNAAWRAAGVYHVLSVSGLHLAVVALLGFAAARKLIAALGLARSRPPATYAALPALAAAAAYTAITGAEIATLRALIVVAIVVLGSAVEHPVRIADAIAAAAIVLLAHRPTSVHDPSFQLSFVAAAVLASLPPRRDRATPPPITRRIAATVARGILASAWVTAATAPLTAAAFGQIAYGGVLGNLLVTPAIELVVIPATLLGLAATAVFPAAGALGIAAACALTDLLDRVTRVLADLTPAIAILPPTPVELALWTAAWVVPLLAVRRILRVRTAALLVAAIAIAAAGVRVARHRALAHPGELVVTFLDVGQGDAAVIETPDGETWLVDAGGEPGLGAARGSAPGAAVARFLTSRGRDRLDLVIVSHPHPDHYLGLLALVDRVAIDTVLVAIDPAETGGELASVLDRLRATGARVAAPPLGLARVAGGARLEVLAPRYRPIDPPLVAGGDPVRSVNDNSLVVAVDYAGRRVLFLGDLEAEGEHDLAAAGLARADVVKVAHHGSATSSTPELVAATRASIAAISCGRANRFGFPRAIVLDRWTRAGARVVRTDADGAIAVTIDRGGAVSTTTAR